MSRASEFHDGESGALPVVIFAVQDGGKRPWRPSISSNPPKPPVWFSKSLGTSPHWSATASSYGRWLVSFLTYSSESVYWSEFSELEQDMRAGISSSITRLVTSTFLEPDALDGWLGEASAARGELMAFAWARAETNEAPSLSEPSSSSA